MHFNKCIIPLFILCLINSSHGKPADVLTEGRGIGSTLWGWITYPFSWWSSSEPEQAPTNDQPVETRVYGPFDNVEIAKHNVTVWCNDQTCTTMKCDKYGCKNVTCNIYDTDLRGECREYNTVIKPEEPVPPKPKGVTDVTLQDKTSESTKVPEATSTQKEIVENQPNEDHPLELEVVLSSTVTESTNKNSVAVKIDKTVRPQNKI